MPRRADLPPLLAELTTRNAVRVDHETFGRDSAVVVETVAETLGPHRRAAARRRLVLPLLAVGLVLLVALGVFVVLPALRNDEVVERVLTGQSSPACPRVTTAVRDGRPVAITGDGDGTIRIWDLLSGELVGTPLTGHTGFFYSLSTTELDGRTVIVSSGDDATIRVWDLVTGAPVGPTRAGSDAINVVSTDVVDGRPVVVTTTNADRAVVVDLATDRPLGPPLAGHEGGILDSATGVLDGRPVVVTVDRNWKIGAWDLGTGAAVGGAASCTGSGVAEPVDVSAPSRWPTSTGSRSSSSTTAPSCVRRTSRPAKPSAVRWTAGVTGSPGSSRAGSTGGRSWPSAARTGPSRSGTSR